MALAPSPTVPLLLPVLLSHAKGGVGGSGGEGFVSPRRMANGGDFERAQFPSSVEEATAADVTTTFATTAELLPLLLASQAAAAADPRKGGEFREIDRSPPRSRLLRPHEGPGFGEVSRLPRMVTKRCCGFAFSRSMGTRSPWLEFVAQAVCEPPNEYRRQRQRDEGASLIGHGALHIIMLCLRGGGAGARLTTPPIVHRRLVKTRSPR
jgi:hypothetical protein